MRSGACTLETADAPVPGASLFDVLLGRTILACSSIVLTETDEVFELDYIAVLELDDGTRAEILVDDPLKALRLLGPTDAPEIWGEFEPVTLSTKACDLGEIQLPLRVARIEVAMATSCQGRWEGPGGAWGPEYVLGAILWDESGRGLALRTDGEDLHFELPEQLRSYVAQWWPSDSEWTVRDAE